MIFLQKRICYGGPEITGTQDYMRELKKWKHLPVINYREYIRDFRSVLVVKVLRKMSKSWALSKVVTVGLLKFMRVLQYSIKMAYFVVIGEKLLQSLS